jgi:selenide,water dikinase
VANRRFLVDWVTYDSGIDEASELILCDAQTSGGLLIAVAPDRVDALVASLRRAATPTARVVGSLSPGAAGSIRVTRTRG